MLTDRKRKLAATRDVIDPVLRELRALQLTTPRRGWVKTIRECLGITARRLAKNAGVDETTLIRLEENEWKGTITLNSLRRLSEAMDCELVYAVVPRKDLFEILSERAELVLRREEKKTKRTMSLEAQGGEEVSDARRDAQKALLLLNLDRRLWEDDE
jgi:predicted DNA-binding mobile mystery protein A